MEHESSRKRLRTSESPDGRKVATWRLTGRDCEVVHFVDRADSSTAYRWPGGAELPAAPRGLVLLDGPPSLWEARDAFPFHRDLWDAVKADYWAALQAVPESATGRTGCRTDVRVRDSADR